jgi:hypothetical protein
MQQVFACRFVSATGAVAEQDVVASTWGFVQTQGIKLDCRFYLADRQAEMRGDFADSLVGDMALTCADVIVRLVGLMANLL